MLNSLTIRDILEGEVHENIRDDQAGAGKEGI